MRLDTFNNLASLDTIQSKIAVSSSGKVAFKNVKEVVQDKKTHPWVNVQGGKSSCALHFNLDNVDTLCIEYSAECWFMFPFKTNLNNITVYWDKIIDSKYDFNIVKTIARIDPKYSSKPFMILELLNDTTLAAKYPYPKQFYRRQGIISRHLFCKQEFKMKIFLFILILLLQVLNINVFGQEMTNLKEENLKGNVKSVLQINYHGIDTLGVIQKKDTLGYMLTTYNSFGNCIEKCTYFSNGELKDKESYSYDSSGNLIKMDLYISHRNAVCLQHNLDIYPC
jgi:hypothetical protein